MGSPSRDENGVTFAPGEVKEAFSFVGARVDPAHVDAGNGANLNFVNAVTIDAWIKTPGAPTQDAGIIDKGGYAAAGYALAHAGTDGVFDDKIHFEIERTILTSTSVINDNQFHHIAGTYDGSFMRIYIDGVEENFVVMAGTFDPTGLYKCVEKLSRASRLCFY